MCITYPVPPVYIQTHKCGALKRKIELAYDRLQCCSLCPRSCGVNRTAGETGICNTGKDAVVCSFSPHFGEEAPLVGQNGSGTIFFSYCNMLCNFCQNFEISHEGEGRVVTPDQIAYMMISLQNQGCHNINFVSPSHGVPQILAALEIAIEQGLSVPLIYNTGGYDSVETLQLLDGVIDIYMPDIKFLNGETAELSGVPRDYPEVVKKAVIEMYRQVGDLDMVWGEKRGDANDAMYRGARESGIARRGLLVRHLVLPDGLADTEAVMRFLKNEVSADTYVNIMSQYRPCGTAHEIPRLSRRVTGEEYHEAIQVALKEGITRLAQ